MKADIADIPSLKSYTLAELRNGTGWVCNAFVPLDRCEELYDALSMLVGILDGPTDKNGVMVDVPWVMANARRVLAQTSS